MIQSENYQKAVEELQGILQRFRKYKVNGKDLEEVKERRERVYARYKPIFRDIKNLSESDFHSFLSFDGNEHWTGLERQKIVTKDINKLRNALKLCLDERIDDCLKDSPKGLGRAIITAFLLVATEGQYAVWNGTSKKALDLLKIWPLDSNKFNGENYNTLNIFLKKLARSLSTDLWVLDWLLWIVIETSKKRKPFIESYGATCTNFRWSGSFVNDEEQFVIFGSWEHMVSDNQFVILKDDWGKNKHGRKKPAYKESLEHLNLIREKGYRLKIFLMQHSDERKDEKGDGPAKIKSFDPYLIDVSLERKENGWYATHAESGSSPQTPPEEIPEGEESNYPEGGKKQITINAYERNPEAREKCIEHYGPTCRICGFNFGKTYGDKYKRFIHIHHIKPVSEMPDSYEVDPIKDLIPVCPNCHAVIHYGNQTLPIEEVKKLLKK